MDVSWMFKPTPWSQTPRWFRRLMLGLLVVMVGLVAIGMANTQPSGQDQFESQRIALAKRYSKAPNNVQEDLIAKQAYAWAATWRASTGGQVNGWRGRVDKVYLNPVTDLLEVDIVAGDTFSPVTYVAHLKQTDPLYAIAVQMGNREAVTFSGVLLPDDRLGIKERSITTAGGLQRPEFALNVTAIAPR